MIKEDYGRILLRLTMAGVFLYFGFSQLFDGVSWVSLVPESVSNFVHLPPAMIVLANGAFEVVLATVMALGFWVGPIAILLAIHLLGIALSFGLTPIGVRDLGLSLATLSIFFLEP